MSLLKKMESFLDASSRNTGWILLIIFLLAFMVRALPFQFDGSFDPDAHFHARLSDEIARTHELVEWDSLSLQGRVYSYPPLLHILTALFSIVSGLDSMLVLKIVGTLLGAFFAVSTFLLAFQFSRSKSIALWSALFASLSAIAVWRTAGFTRPDGIALTLIPFILYLWLSRRDKLAFVLSVSFVLLHTLSSGVLGFLLLAMLALALARKESFSPLLPLALGGMLLMVGAWFFSVGLPLSSYASHLSLDSSELVRFFALSYILFFPFSWAFALTGIAKAKLPLLLLTWFIFTLALSMLGVRLAAYMIPFFSVVGGYGMAWVIQKIHSQKYTIPVLGILLVVLGGATVWLLMDGIHPYVSASERSAIDYLADYSQPNQSVLTIWDQGHVLAYYTHLPQVIDGYFEFAHELDARDRVMHAALNSSDCSTFLNALDEFHAHYFFLPGEDLHSSSAEWGVLQLPRCPGIRVAFASDGAMLYERV